jgi:hypothetical protein
MLNTLILIAGVAWILWKFFQGKNLRNLFIAFFFIALILAQWPLFFPMKLVFAIWSFTAAGFMFYENFYKKNLRMLLQ